jgi:hypothetical protein
VKESIARNHHFISQAEQRLNAIDKTVNNKNQRIYSFDILHREDPKLKASSPKSVRIEENFARTDLYTLSVLESGGQHNLEDAFFKYENDSSRLAQSLLQKLDSSAPETLGSELVRLYQLKLINTLRNPYAIRRTLDMFSQLRGVVPADEALRAHFKSLDGAYRPQVEKICAEFKVSEEEYIDWLKVLYLLILQPIEGERNLIEVLMWGLFNNSDAIKSFSVYRYSDDTKDRGILLCDQIIDLRYGEGMQFQMFNLDSSSFILVTNIEIKTQSLIGISSKLKELDFRQRNVVHVDYVMDDTNMLRRFNEHCVWLAHLNVFCAFDKPFGIPVEPQASDDVQPEMRARPS